MLKQLKKCLESEKLDESIFEIILYGSLMKGKESPRDVDIVVLFTAKTLRERLDIVQYLKTKWEPLNLTLDVKQMLLSEFFREDNLSRTGILLEGTSILQERKLCELMGFKAFALYWYTLTELSHAQKVKFNYVLAGRKSVKGMLAQLGGERLANGALKVPIEHSSEMDAILTANNVQYTKKEILEII